MNDPHKPLRDDVGLLGELLGDTLREHGGLELFARVERVRAAAKSSRQRGTAASDVLASELEAMPIEQATPVARAFAHFLALANIAEQHHRARRRRQYASAPGGRPQPGSCAEAFARFTRSGIAPSRLVEAVAGLSIELVLTAHPTEITRRRVIHKHNRIANLLAFRDRPDLTPTERTDSLAALRREIATAWQTDESREHDLSAIDEVRAGLMVFEQSLWRAVPAFLRELDSALQSAAGAALPAGATPVRFGSWIGGDRDGNPNVSAEVTRKATWLARWQAAALYVADVEALRDELSLTTATPELVERACGAREPYRALLTGVRDRLRSTRAWAETELGSPAATPFAETHPRPYLRAAELYEDLRLCDRSLRATGNALVADGRLLDLLRLTTTFGLVLAPLDLRQEAARHLQAVDWLLRSSDGVEYAGADESGRQRMLLDRLSRGHAPGAFTLQAAPDSVRDVIETFQVAASIEPESLGAYVITMASRPSDVLAVEWLQTAVGNRHPQRVVPLFETATDLQAAGRVLDDLFAMPWYRQRIAGRQEVMVGYSDSAKDAGRFSAAWMLYRAQEEIVACARRAGVRLTLFHGRGGTVGRGGGPTYLALRSQPPGSVEGALRVTEQGEMIQAKFGITDIAVRTLEVYTTSTLEAGLMPPDAPQRAWRDAIETLSSTACDAYRAVVRDDRWFVPYFRAATPEPELRTLRVGSRPARRPAGDDEGLASLRAIPWQFAWTQTRLLLASWLGVEAVVAQGNAAMLREMYEEWPFFQSTIDLIEMVLAKADGRIAELYDRALVPADLLPLGAELRARLSAAVTGVLRVTGHAELLESNPVLRRSIAVRNPYVDPINLVQIELLRRLRTSDSADERLQRAFAITVNGIAAGMRNTG